MKVAFDATVVHGSKSGVGYYSQELLRALLTLDSPDEYYVFSHRPLSPSLVVSGEHVRFSDKRHCPVRAFYLHFLLPGLLRKEKPDLVHYTNFLAPVNESHPYLVTLHDMSLERLRTHHHLGKRHYTRRLVPRTARRARLILTNSDFSKWDIVRFLGIPEDRIRVTPLAASALFRPIDEAKRQPVLDAYGLGEPYFLYVGNIEPRKNLQRLLEAFASIRDRGHRLVIAGNWWFRGRQVIRKTRELSLTDEVCFLGYVPRRHLPALISGAEALVYPSLLEGFGLPVLEAMACGCPVITSDNSSLRQLAGDAGLLVDPTKIGEIADAMVALSEDADLAASLSRKALLKAGHFSWKQTAESTRQAYLEALDGRRGAAVAVAGRAPPDPEELERAVRRTVDYATRFDYPLSVPELHERLFGVRTDAATLQEAIIRMGLGIVDGYLSDDPEQIRRRKKREAISDRVIDESWRHMRVLAAFPFVRMIAFSGATAHRNMRAEDLDLFAIVEDGKLWATLLGVTVWAKFKGLRQKVCLNYVISDRALSLFETDPFTAQQAASLKPFYGKLVYERFIRVNPFIQRHFPNFDPSAHSSRYPELTAAGYKKLFESVLRVGAVQVLDVASRWVLGAYLRSKGRVAARDGDSEVLFGRMWIKLHLHGHKRQVLGAMDQTGGGSGPRSIVHPVPSAFAPAPDERQQEDAEVQPK